MIRSCHSVRNSGACLASLLLITLLSSLLTVATASAQTEIPVRVDPRVELLGIIFHLAGNPEYNDGKIPSYEEDIQKSFGAFENHQAVVLAKELREQSGVSFDAVMSLALHVTDPPALDERTPLDPLPAFLDQRWTPETSRRFLVAARDFAVQTNFMAFFADHHGLYSLTENRMKIALDSQDLADWCIRYFGGASDMSFHLELGMLNGGSSYGPRFQAPGQPLEFHSVLGVWQIDSAGMPEFSLDVLKTVMHEFLHSFINPLTVAHESELASAGRKLYAAVGPIMEGLAYRDWQTVINESLVRAVTIRWVATQAKPSLVLQAVAYQQKMGFYWIDGLNDLLAQYESRRGQYPTFTDFLPKIEVYLGQYAANADARIDAVEARWNDERKIRSAAAPHVVAMTPPNGSEDVDPGTTVLSFTFDRPMLDKHWSVMQTGSPMPEITGDVSYNAERTVFSIPVALTPSTTYKFALNRPDGGGFRDEAGNQLLEYVVKFSTQP